MRDFTSGSLSRHLLDTTGFMLVMMVVQTLYFLIDLYWVGRLGTPAVAGVGIAGNLTFVVMALGQTLGVGTTAVIAHAAGRKDHADARHLFNQSLGLALLVGALFLAAGMLLRGWFARTMSADAETARMANDYLTWFIPAMALQFPMGAMAAALRGVGLFKPGMLVSTASVVLNMLLAPFLIFGWVTGRPLGVAGAAISSLVAVAGASLWLTRYFLPKDAVLHFARDGWAPDLRQWRKMLAIGMPAGVEFLMMALYQFMVYTLARPFGAAAQAGFGIGMRVMQAGMMPVIALGFAVAPVAGQNFGARMAERVRATYTDAARMSAAAMFLFFVACQFLAAPMIGAFTADAAVVDMGAEYLRIATWGSVASGLVFVTASMFQAMGNTVPTLVASFVRVALVFVPAILLSRTPGFALSWIWYLTVGSLWSQFALVYWFLRREYGKRLMFAHPT